MFDLKQQKHELNALYVLLMVGAAIVIMPINLFDSIRIEIRSILLCLIVISLMVVRLKPRVGLKFVYIIMWVWILMTCLMLIPDRDIEHYPQQELTMLKVIASCSYALLVMFLSKRWLRRYQ